MISNKEIILKIDLETLTIGMSCMSSLEHLFPHVSHSLVVRILAYGAGGPGSNPGGVTYGMGEEGQWILWVMHGVYKCVVGSEFILLFAVKNVISID